jgi:hypothetical protein
VTSAQSDGRTARTGVTDARWGNGVRLRIEADGIASATFQAGGDRSQLDVWGRLGPD